MIAKCLIIRVLALCQKIDALLESPVKLSSITATYVCNMIFYNKLKYLFVVNPILLT